MANGTANKPSTNEPFPAFEFVPDADVAGPAIRPPEQPIRFPHIPSIHQSPPGNSRYVLIDKHDLRVDKPHLPNSLVSQQNETSQSAASVPAIREPVSIPVKPAKAPRDRQPSADQQATQIAQIAEYLRRKRNELESVQTDLQLSALKQQTAILQEKEQLRGQQLNIQMVQATLEVLRRQLVEFGETLSREAGGNDVLVSGFELVCQSYFDAAQVAKLLDADV